MRTRAVVNVEVPSSGRVRKMGASERAAYADALQREIEANAAEFADVEVTALRLGGGQASSLGGEGLVRVVTVLRKCLDVLPEAPLSLRCSPADITAAWFPLFKRAGTSRYDIEMLTLCETSFHRLSPEGDLGLYPLMCNSLLHSEQAKNLGLVLVVGDPRQSDIECRRGFLAAHRYGCVHVTVEVYRGPGSDEERAACQLKDAHAVLTEAGFLEYAPRRFALSGHEDPFEKALGLGANVIGFGAGAVTRFEGAYSVNTEDLAAYLAFSDDFSRITREAGKVQDRGVGLFLI